MQVKFDLVIGTRNYTLLVDVANQMDFFKKLSFYSSLPQVGPNGETDLELTYRVAQKQYEYFSIVSKQAGMEFKFGQYKERDGELFAKGWEPLFQTEGEQDTQATGGLGAPAPAQQASAPSNTVGLGSAAPKAAPRPIAAAPRPAAKPTAAPRPAATAPATTAQPQVNAQVNTVLAKFGIH